MLCGEVVRIRRFCIHPTIFANLRGKDDSGGLVIFEEIRPVKLGNGCSSLSGCEKMMVDKMTTI